MATQDCGHGRRCRLGCYNVGVMTQLSPPSATRATSIDPLSLLRPRRRITGMSAILLPFSGGAIDWPGFSAHVERTADAGLLPAVNMDTGYVNLLDDAERLAVLDRTQRVLAGRPFVAGAFVADSPESRFDRDAYLRQIEPIVSRGGTPVIFQSYGLTGLGGRRDCRRLFADRPSAAIASSASSWGRCSRRSARSIRSTSTAACSACRHASGPSIRRCIAIWNGSGLPCAIPFGPTSWSSPATTWRSTW